jgi:hypothetical protein
VGEIRRADRNRVDAVLAGSLAGDQLLIAAIAAGRVEPFIDRKGAAPLGVNIEGPGNQYPFAVKACGKTMDIADIGALATADHAQTKRSFDSHCSSSPSMARLALRFAPDLTKSSKARSETRMM